MVLKIQIIVILLLIMVITVSCFQAKPEEVPGMVFIKGGTFQMGEKGEQRTVTVGDFYIGKYEVTNKEYSQYAPSHKGKWSNSDYPVESVSWNDAVGYCKWLSQKAGKNYRLPTEAEWEYAYHAGSSTTYYWGDSMNDSYCWYNSNSGSTAHPIGQKQPNAWSLFDMSGNVWEWCNDWYGDYPSGSVTNPTGPSTGSFRISRGGGWRSDAEYCQSVSRGSFTPNTCDGDLGFRLLRTP